MEARGVPRGVCESDGVKLGVQLRATVSSFGPLLLAKVLSLNETQTSVLTLVFKYADDQQLPLLDFSDLRALLQYLTSDEGKGGLAAYGGMSTTTVGVLLRKMVELEASGRRDFLRRAGVRCPRPPYDYLRRPGSRDLTRAGRCAGQADALLYLHDVAAAELYHTLPEVGDVPQPKTGVLFDEAHLLFHDASKAFLDEIEQVIRLIRQKGVGVYFVTQTPKDVPEPVLAQLSNRVQHALRAHTPDDDKALTATVRTFPKTPFYDLSRRSPRWASVKPS